MDRWELEAAAAKVTYMRGLLALPLGAVFILVGLTNLEWGPFQSTWLFFVGVAAAGASWVAAARYYNDHYGRVTPGDRPRLRARRMAATGIYGVALIGGPFLDAQVQPSVSLFAALFAVAMLSWYKLCVQLRAHHIMIWGALLVAALVPVWGSLPDPISVAALPIGLAMIVTGVLDHRALVRGFGPARHADVADSYAGA